MSYCALYALIMFFSQTWCQFCFYAVVSSVCDAVVISLCDAVISYECDAEVSYVCDAVVSSVCDSVVSSIYLILFVTLL